MPPYRWHTERALAAPALQRHFFEFGLEWPLRLKHVAKVLLRARRYVQLLGLHHVWMLKWLLR